MPRTHAEQVTWSETVLPEQVRRPPAGPERVDRPLDEVSLGPFAPPRCGRPSTPIETYLRLMFGYLTELGLLGGAITRIAVTGLWIQAAGRGKRTTLRDRSRAAGKRAHGIAAKLRMRSAQGRDQARAVVKRITGARPTWPERPPRMRRRCWSTPGRHYVGRSTT